jgi:malonyl-CoA O-methyltransferase
MSIDTARVVTDFDRSAETYECEARLQFQILSQLVDLCRPYLAPHSHVLDVGCGTGWLVHALNERALDWKLQGMDISFSMCQMAQRKGISVMRARAESLPCADASYDVVFSSLCVQWLDTPQKFIREALRVLKPNGILAIATLGARTLYELKQAFSVVDSAEHLIEFKPLSWWRAQIEGVTQARQILTHSECWVNPYPSMRALCESLREIGAENKHMNRSRHFMGARRFAAAEQAYMHYYSRASGGVSASWEPLFLVYKKEVV